MVSPKLKWELNQQIMCLYKGHKYEAKIIEANMNNSECVYKIHYKVNILLQFFFYTFFYLILVLIDNNF